MSSGGKPLFVRSQHQAVNRGAPYGWCKALLSPHG